MTIFRSNRWDILAYVLAFIGFAGFMTCGAINMGVQERVLVAPEFRERTADRPVEIKLKGLKLFVEPAYGRRFNLAEDLIMPFWLVLASGIALGNRARIAAWWKSRKS